MSTIRIIGIDPGTLVAGYGIIDLHEKRFLKAVAAGAWRLGKDKPLHERLATLAIEFRKIISVYEPTHLCMELSFLADNPRTALFLGHARGVILSEASQAHLMISEISATAVKKMVSGNGRATKESIAKIMASTLGVVLEKLPYDATDALAIAYTDGVRQKSQSKI